MNATRTILELVRKSPYAKTIAYPRSSFILSCGAVLSRHEIYVMFSGAVKIVVPDKSAMREKHLGLGIRGRGDILNEWLLFGQEKSPWSAQAMRECTIAVLPLPRFQESMVKNPSFNEAVLSQMLQRLFELQNIYEEMVFRNIPQRVASVLLKIVENFGVETDEGITIDFKVTHQDLADLVGATRENVTMALNQLTRKGIITKRRFLIVIKDAAVLREVADGRKTLG